MFKSNDVVSDGITSGADLRRQRGLEIAALARIEQRGDTFIVPSQLNPRQTKYIVRTGEKPSCTCADHETRGCKCKHIYAVEFAIRREKNDDGSTTITESVTFSNQRQTYPQNWKAYNKAQTNEKRQFQSMLHDLCKTVQSAAGKPRKGRPPIAIGDAIFACVFKIYANMSARRFTSDLCDAQEKGYIAKVPHFNSVLNYLENADLFPILTDMIERTSAPLKAVESQFAVDSTGFTACRFVRWYDVKYNRFTSEQQWVKAHIMCGVKTNIVTAIEIYGKNTGDALALPGLVQSTAKRFDVKEVSADKGYSTLSCHDAIDKIGAMPYIAFKANTTGGVGGMFEKMWHYFNLNRETFLQHYHRRSNVESTVMMIKSKFGDSVRSKTDAAARNEVLCKVLCHNLCCLIHAMHELGIEANFGCTNKSVPAQEVV